MNMKRYYINVEWDILRVPAERHVKVYPCCPEPYPGCLPCLFVADCIVLNQIILMLIVFGCITNHNFKLKLDYCL